MKILFIGNSYTYYNDMPCTLEKLLAENGFASQVDSVTVGGRKLYKNLDREDEKFGVIKELSSKNNYDALILQEQSFLPITEPETFERGVFGLMKTVESKRTVLYATWGRKSGCDLLVQHGWTSDSMTDMLYEAYSRAAVKFGAELSPVGKCFKQSVKTYPDIELYDPDLSHPSREGSALAAMVHYVVLIGELPKKYSSLKLEEKVAQSFISAIKSIVWEEK